MSTRVDIPDQVVKPSSFDVCCGRVEDGVRLTGGAGFAVGALVSGFVGGSVVVTVLCAGTSAGFFFLHLMDKTCGRGNTITRLFNDATRHYGLLQEKQKGLITAENRTVDDTNTVVQKDTLALEQAKQLTEKSKETEAVLQASAAQVHDSATAVVATASNLANELQAEKEENAALKTKLNEFTLKIAQLHADVQKAADLIPSLKAIDLSMDHGAQSFKENADKILRGFSQAITQIQGHNDENEKLKAQTELLQRNLNEIEGELNKQKATCLELRQENDQFKGTNKSLIQLRQELEALGLKLDAEKQDLAKKKQLFETEKQEWSDLSRALQRTQEVVAAATSSNTPSEMHTMMQQRLAANAAQLQILKQLEKE